MKSARYLLYSIQKAGIKADLYRKREEAVEISAEPVAYLPAVGAGIYAGRELMKGILG